jgi:hypothetical protein
MRRTYRLLSLLELSLPPPPLLLLLLLLLLAMSRMECSSRVRSLSACASYRYSKLTAVSLTGQSNAVRYGTVDASEQFHGKRLKRPLGLDLVVSPTDRPTDRHRVESVRSTEFHV